MLAKYHDEQYLPPEVQHQAIDLYNQIPWELLNIQTESIKMLLQNTFMALTMQGKTYDQLQQALRTVEELQNQLYARKHGKNPKNPMVLKKMIL